MFLEKETKALILMEKQNKNKPAHLFEVRKELCTGCGLCASSCPKDAISFLWGKAEIDQNRCVHCGLCLRVCPRGAIVEKVVIEAKALEKEIQSLQMQVEAILERLDRLTGVK